jgi:Bifunctional DNA primase/polymerase, N-terminal
MAQKVRPGVGAPGPAEAVASNDGNHPTRPQPQGQAEKAALSAALYYAAMGLRVFPCLNNPGHKDHKKPLTNKGFKDATCDPKKITRWWTRWPISAIGIERGESPIKSMLELSLMECLAPILAPICASMHVDRVESGLLVAMVRGARPQMVAARVN